MDEQGAWDLLERGGAVRRGHFLEPGGHAEARLLKYNGLPDPAGAEALGVALAERLADAGATVVVVWEEVEDLVLGFVVARQLGCRLVWAYDDGGLVSSSSPLAQGEVAVLVTDQARDVAAVRAVRALLESRGGTLARVGALVGAGSVGGTPSVGLLPGRVRLHPASDCPLCRQGVPLETPSAAEV
jgi:orotate phosphoribosyltransferase